MRPRSRRPVGADEACPRRPPRGARRCSRATASAGRERSTPTPRAAGSSTQQRQQQAAAAGPEIEDARRCRRRSERAHASAASISVSVSGRGISVSRRYAQGQAPEFPLAEDVGQRFPSAGAGAPRSSKPATAARVDRRSGWPIIVAMSRPRACRRQQSRVQARRLDTLPRRAAARASAIAAPMRRLPGRSGIHTASARRFA